MIHQPIMADVCAEDEDLRRAIQGAFANDEFPNLVRARQQLAKYAPKRADHLHALKGRIKELERDVAFWANKAGLSLAEFEQLCAAEGKRKVGIQFARTALPGERVNERDRLIRLMQDDEVTIVNLTRKLKEARQRLAANAVRYNKLAAQPLVKA